MEKEKLTMIPGCAGGEYKSNAERKVFRLLQETALEGYAFHSVGLPEHEKKSYSEADFIVLTRYGVLCLEVKGGRVDCVDGTWTFENRYGHIDAKREGPFEQASGALFALKAALAKRFVWAKDISYAAGVVFTDITFNYRGVSVIPDILYDYSSRQSFAQYISECHSYWDDKNRKRYMPLTDAEIEDIRKFIRDDLHFVPSLGNIVRATDEGLIRLTEEQITTFAGLADNKRIVVNGVAGSGKTLLAYQHALNCAEQGKRVLFLVYNKMLANYLNASTKSPLLTIAHFHGLISNYIPIDPQSAKDASYYSAVLPETFLKYLSTHNIGLYDVLVLDEGQDLVNPKNLRIFDKLLKGGLYSGTWCLFYDRNQNLFNPVKFDKGMEQLQEYRPALFALTRNCRNTMPIAKLNKICSGIDCGKGTIDGEKVEFMPYAKDFALKFDEVVDGLINTDIKAEDISILSPNTYENSIIASYMGKYSGHIEKFNGRLTPGKIRYATIQSFKGMDSQIVIALDLQQSIDNSYNKILYTLISRARTLLYIMLPSDADERFRNSIILKISETENESC